MKKLLLIILFSYSTGAFAQLPVIDVASLAQAIATVTELRQQAGLMAETLGLTRAIRRSTEETERLTDRHLRRFEASLTRRGLVSTTPLAELTRPISEALAADQMLSYVAMPAAKTPFIGHARAADPLAHGRSVTERSLATMEGALEALAVQGRQLERSHAELERFKREIAQAAEPQQLRDVKASLEVLRAREQLMTRQSLVLLANLEAVRAAAALDREAQARTQYETFVGGADWAQSARRPRRPFLRMPGR